MSGAIFFSFSRSAGANGSNSRASSSEGSERMCSAFSHSALASKGSSSVKLRSEEHTSELQSLRHLVCRLLLEKKKNRQYHHTRPSCEPIRLSPRVILAQL